MTEIAMTGRLALPYEEAVRRVKAVLAEEGFGVLTEIDVRSTLREKLGVAGAYIETLRGVGYRFAGENEEVR